VSLPPLLKSFQWGTVAFFLVSLSFHLFAFFVLHRHGHVVYPFSLNKTDRFGDFTVFTEKFTFFHTTKFFEVGFPINYPAPAVVALEAFFKFAAPHSLFVFLVFCILAFVVPAGLFGRAIVLRGIAPGQAALFVTILCVLSWPAGLIVDGANAEVIVWMVLLIGMWAYATGREWLAAALFGIAASLKLFPFVFLAFFLSRRQIGKLFFGVGTFLVISVVSLQVLGPTIPVAYRGINFGLLSFKQNYMAMWHTGENGVDHSIFATVKLLLLAAFHRNAVHHYPVTFTGPLRVYIPATAIAGALLYFLRIRKQPLLNQVLTLTIISIYFTPFSGDGTLIHLYYPLAMLFLLAIRARRDGVTIPGLSTILYCMVFCLSMESFLVAPGSTQGMRFIGPAHCIALGVMLVAALRYPLGPPLAEDRGEIVLSEPVTGWVKRLPAP